MAFQFGIDQLLNSNELLSRLEKARCGLVAHPASITTRFNHSLDALMLQQCNIVKSFGPQHGMRGDKQDNMIESEDYLDPLHQIPVLSLYGEHRKPTEEMLQGLDIVLFDLQDIGCRIYTYITTLKYFIEACAAYGVELWVLDRPNPAGRPVDGLRLEAGQESFVGCDLLPTRHGMTVAELAQWICATNNIDLSLTVVPMQDYRPDEKPGLGWPVNTPWVNPSPNASSVNMSRCFSGTVLLEGTELSEGRGTTIPLEVIGAPALPIDDMLAILNSEAPAWLEGALLRPCYFEPTFHKHQHKLCRGLQIHTDAADYDHHHFTPYRLIAGCLKALRTIDPDYGIWRHHEYEYELGRIPIDVINGGEGLRHWVDDETQTYEMLESILNLQLKDWCEERAPYLIYP